MWKKIISLTMTLVMLLVLFAFSDNVTNAADEDGDICTNPWGDMFTTTPGDLDIPDVNHTTKEEITTKGNNDTDTKKEESNKVSKPTRTKILKATVKYKKVKITLKNVKGAKGYKIQISKNKKFKKNIVSRNYRKTRISITSKKFGKTKKIYIRARAYKLNKKVKIWGKWTKGKLIKRK